MAAWATARIQAPHFAAAPYNYGRHIPESRLQPGDLVFLYSDVHHVEIYIGNGRAVSAPQEGEYAKIVRIANFQDAYYEATRLA